MDTLEKLGSIDIPLIGRGGQIGNGFFHVLLHLPAIQEQLAELILSESISLICRLGKPIQRRFRILWDIFIGQIEFSEKILCILMILLGSSCQIEDGLGDVLREQFSIGEDLAQQILCCGESSIRRESKQLHSSWKIL